MSSSWTTPPDSANTRHAHFSMSNPSKYAPSELRLTQTWDYIFETTITRTAIGFAVAGLFSVVAFRKYS
jgi:hypothetical protein